MLKKPRLRPILEIPKSKDKIFVAYLIVHTNTKRVYVGSTGQPGIRFKSHFRELAKGKHINYKLQEAYDTDPTFHTILYKVKNRAKAFDLEQALINYYLQKGLVLNISLNARFTRRRVVIRSDGTVKRRKRRRRYYKKDKDYSQNYKDYKPKAKRRKKKRKKKTT